MKISAVINTHNEEKNLPRCLNNIEKLVDEIIVVDMESTDDTRKIAKEHKAKIYSHPFTGYVEPARNYALNKATGNWILLLDADEVVSKELLSKLAHLAEYSDYDFIRIPRKNIIFDRWIRHTGWWPDYQIRFFQKNAVSWGDEIHSIPVTTGKGFDLPPNEENAFIHYNYQTISQFIDRLNRYTTIEAQEVSHTVQFSWWNSIQKPWQEFLKRFFQSEGYKDGLHGLALSLLQSFYVFVVELKVWENHSFTEVAGKTILNAVKTERDYQQQDFHYWYFHMKAIEARGLTKLWYKVRARFRI